MSPYTIKQILVPVDLSETALNAVETAAVIAHQAGATLHLLFVDEPLQLLAEGTLATTSTPLPRKDILLALSASLRNRYQVNTELIFSEGNVPETILRTARGLGATLIVMGTHGASGARDGFVGHNTYYTIKYSTVPVLAIPATATPGLFHHVIYPFRLVAGAQMLYEQVLPFVYPGATIELLSISQKLLDTTNRALHSFSDEVAQKCAHKKVDVRIAQGTSMRIGKELVKYAGRFEGGLVVINSALDVSNNPFFIGPHTQTVINCLKSPMLLIPMVMEQAKSAQEALYHVRQPD